jgi:HAD superfamily phosphoserine phosphatase-like hydrolase
MEKWRRDGVRLVLVTGGLDLFMEPMAREFGAECIAPSLEERGGIFTGALTGPPLAGEAKADAVRAHAARHGVDLRESWALGDAPGDLPMLALAGRPVVVNPGGQLARVAAQRGWTVERWRP